MARLVARVSAFALMLWRVAGMPPPFISRREHEPSPAMRRSPERRHNRKVKAPIVAELPEQFPVSVGRHSVKRASFW